MSSENLTNKTELVINDTGLTKLDKKALDNVRTHIGDAMGGLGFLDQMNLKWRTNKEIVSQVEASVISLLRKQSDAIEYQMLLDLDAEKKRRFQSYLSEIGSVEHSIVQTTENVKHNLHNYLTSSVTNLLMEKNEKMANFDHLQKDNKLTTDDVELLQSLTMETTIHSIDNLKQKIHMLLQQHADTYTKTLEIMKVKVLQTT